jgi:hypothetical protein
MRHHWRIVLILLLVFIAITAITLAPVLASTTGNTAATAWNVFTFNWAGAAATFAGRLVMSFLGVPIFMSCVALLIPGRLLAFVLPDARKSPSHSRHMTRSSRETS